MKLQTSNFLTLAVSALLLGSASLGSAATIIWSGTTGTTISGSNTDVSTNGTGLQAFNLGSGLPTLINGVTFAAGNVVDGASGTATFGAGPGTLTLTSTDPGNWFNAGYGSGLPPYSDLTIAYRALLEPGVFLFNGPATATISGLTAGQTYEVQFWLIDSRGAFAGNRAITFTAGNSIVADANTNDAEGGLGQFVTGTFIADGATQVISLSPQNFGTQLNGYQIRTIAVPEPSALAGLGIVLIARRRSAVRA